MRTRVIVLLFLSAMLTACGTLYSGPFRTDVVERDAKYTLTFVELDDQGWFFDRGAVGKALQEVEREVKLNGATVVVYVHGWHHNANSQNVDDFRRTLTALHDELDKTIYRSVRSAVLPGAGNRIVGVYVGWRGRALPGPLPITFWTFWNRRAAALRVGHGDVPELLTRINRIYEEQNLWTPLDKGGQRPFTGLVILGHSFGGQVVYAAVSDVLKHRITEAVEVYDVYSKTRVGKIRGFGDLVVLVNPAVESSVYDSIDQLVREKRFDSTQIPILLTISSERDWPNRWPFSLGRRVSVTQEPRGRPGQYARKTHALGNIRVHVTHCLRLQPDAPCVGHKLHPSPSPFVEMADANLTWEQVKMVLCANVDAVATLPLSGDVRLANDGGGASRFFFQPVDGELDPNLPFMIARAKATIVRSHSDVFSDELRDFVVRYASLVQTKRLAPFLAAECSK